jgi:hypothetical protein
MYKKAACGGDQKTPLCLNVDNDDSHQHATEDGAAWPELPEAIRAGILAMAQELHEQTDNSR